MTTRRQFGRTIVACAGLWGLSLAASRALANDDDPPNVFISPCGEPFRAKQGAPYPVAAWFKQADKNADGRLDKTEFRADAGAFFDFLDVNKDGVLDGAEISRYEHQVAPEILGFRVNVGDARGVYGGRFWLAQVGGEYGPTGGAGYGPDPDSVDWGPAHDIDESGAGASPYSFFPDPEPVMAADADLNGIIRKAAFLHLADSHFDKLDAHDLGYLTLESLPKTKVQIALMHKFHFGA